MSAPEQAPGSDTTADPHLPVRMRISDWSPRADLPPDLNLSDSATIRRAMTFFVDFESRETKETLPAEDHTPDHRVVLTMSEGAEHELLTYHFSWEWSDKWLPLKRGWTDFVRDQKKRAGTEQSGVVPHDVQSTPVSESSKITLEDFNKEVDEARDMLTNPLTDIQSARSWISEGLCLGSTVTE